MKTIKKTFLGGCAFFFFLLGCQYFTCSQDQILPEPAALYRKGEVFERKGEYQKADLAYTKAIDMFQNQDIKAEVLFRLFQSKRKQGKTNEAKNILAKLTNDFPASTNIYIHDYPGPVFNSSWTLKRICLELNQFYSTLPVDVKITAQKSIYSTKEKPKFKVSIKNITKNDISLVCSSSRAGMDNPLVPIEPPSVLIDDRGTTSLHETYFLSKKWTDVTIKPNKAFSYIGTLAIPRYKSGGFLKSGKHVFEFRLKLTCKLKNGKKWEHYILANSIVLNIEKHPNSEE